MNQKLAFTLVAASLLAATALHAETTKTTNVENGVSTTHVYQTDDPAVGDPVGSHGVTSRDDKGPSNTQKFCEQGNTDPDCARAEKRQTSKTTWEDDCASGATKGCKK